MLSFLFALVAFFAAGYYLKRYLDHSGMPKSTSRNGVTFVLALAAAYGVALVVDWIVY